MPVATLAFNLPEEQEEWKITNQASSLHSALWELSEELRTKVKYGDGTPPKDWSEVRDLFYRIVNENGVEL